MQQRLRSLTKALEVASANIRAPARDDVLRYFSKSLAVERDYARPQLWLGFSFLLGASFFFSVPFNIPLSLLGGMAALGCLAAYSLRNIYSAFAATAFLTSFMLGGLAGGWEIKRVESPRLETPLKSAQVQGTVTDIEQRNTRPRVTIKVEKLNTLPGAQLPAHLRLTGVNLKTLRVGARISAEAHLQPIPGPTHPGSYNPGFKAYFDRLGGSGTVAKAPVLLEAQPHSLLERLGLAVAGVRAEATARIKAALPEETGAIAASLVTGDRAALTDELYESFNGSGLMHVLSISGLHMILVAGGMFFAARYLFALFSAFVFELPAKKLAAVTALVMVTAYEIISGGPVATTRSYIMILIVFGAMLLDRPALSMRNIVIAALLIAAAAPHEILGASFQMSFAATAALVAAHERRLFPRIEAWDGSLLARSLSLGLTLFIGTVLTSLVAELATLPFTLHHFHRFSLFGIIGNVLALGFIELAIMPGVLLTLLALPFGMEYWPLQLLGTGVEGMVGVARLVAGFPGALTGVSGYGAASLLLCAFAICWACVWRSSLALFALLPYAAGFAIGAWERPPDIYIAPFGTSVAARTGDGRLSLIASPRDTFTLRRWLENDGDRRDVKDKTLTARQACDAQGCTLALNNGALLASSKDLSGAEEDCARADILILPKGEGPHACPRPNLVIARETIQKAQGLAITFDGVNSDGTRRYAIESVAERCGERPWCRKQPVLRVSLKAGADRSTRARANTSTSSTVSSGETAPQASPEP